nr:Chain A, Microtubule-associated protein tau [Homo sapiens]
KVQIINKKLD